MVGSEYLCDLKGVLARPPLEPIWIRRGCETIGPGPRENDTEVSFTCSPQWHHESERFWEHDMTHLLHRIFGYGPLFVHICTMYGSIWRGLHSCDLFHWSPEWNWRQCPSAHGMEHSEPSTIVHGSPLVLNVGGVPSPQYGHYPLKWLEDWTSQWVPRKICNHKSWLGSLCLWENGCLGFDIIVIAAIPSVPTANQVLFTTTPSTLEMLGESWDVGAKELPTLFHRFSRGSVLFMLMLHDLFVSMVEKWAPESFHEIILWNSMPRNNRELPRGGEASFRHLGISGKLHFSRPCFATTAWARQQQTTDHQADRWDALLTTMGISSWIALVFYLNMLPGSHW